jgi:photosystem II stability/assembly factor-like uncharacterized protein
MQILNLIVSIIFQFFLPGAQPQEIAPLPSSGIIFQSADGGRTWQDAGAGIPADELVLSFFTHGNDIYLGTENGLYRSAASITPIWRKDLLLPHRVTNFFNGRAGLYAISYGSGIFQDVLGAGLWKNVTESLENKNLLTALETPEGLLFAGADNGIYKSADGGQSWKQVYDGGLVLDIVASEGELIAGGMQGVLRSTDGGERWECVLDENILIKKTARLNDRFVAILGTRDHTKIIPEGVTHRLRASDDSGKTWYRLDRAPMPLSCANAMDESLSSARDIYDIVQAGDELFCSFDTGIFRSSDQGKTWRLVLASNKKGTYNLAVRGRVIYAVVATGGC